MLTVYYLWLADGTNNPDGYVTRTYYYDKKGRLLQTAEYDTPTSTISRYSNKYDLAGNVVAAVESHSDGTTTNTKRTDYTYDRFGRLLAEKTTVNASEPVTITYTYDEIGNLASKKLGSSGVTETYTYNLQGMLTSQDSKRMKMDYTYDTQAAGYDNTPRYDGNLSMVKWQYKTSAPKEEAYVYTYDKKGQLAGGKYFLAGTATGIYDENVQYDTNGNITRMQRMGSSADWNTDYSYHYDGNQISSINYTERTRTGTYNFTHDANGNMTNNPRRGWNYLYNHLNLLSHIVDPDAGIMGYYLWLADGTKYGARDIKGNRERFYKGSFTYKGITEADAENVSFSGGEFLATASGFTPNYVISDRLGSPRVVMNSAGTPVTYNSYYPFGLTHYNYLYTEQLVRSNRYHFNGKEKQTFSTQIDFHLLDYGSRMYDPYLCRWTTQDPADQLMNPYVYCGNNPVNFYDPDGEWFLGLIIPGIGTAIDMALWGATIGAASYTVSTAFSKGGFDNWNWNDFGKSVGFGALSGLTTYSVGALFGGLGSFGNELLRSVVHGYTNGCISAAAGGDFKFGFASGALSSLAGSAVWTMDLKNPVAAMYAMSGIGGVIGSLATGGNIWEGLTIGLMNAGMNHLQQSANNWLSYKTPRAQAQAIIDMLAATKECGSVDIRKYFKNFPKAGNGVAYRNVTVMINGEPVTIRYMDIAIWPNIEIDRFPYLTELRDPIFKYSFYNSKGQRSTNAMGIYMNKSEVRGIELLESILYNRK